MSSQRGEVFKTGNGKWSFRYRNLPGRKPVRPQRGGFDTRGDAREALNAELRRLKLGTAARADETLDALIDAFLEQYHAAPSTIEWAEYHLDKVRDQFGSVPLRDLDAQQIARWRQKLPAASSHQTIRVLRQVLRRGVLWRWISENVALAVDNPQPRRAELEPFESWGEIEAICAELSAADGALVVVGAGTGLRPEELFGLERRDVDLDARVVLVRRAWAKGRLKTYAKTDRSQRRVPLRSRVVLALGPQLSRIGDTQRAIVFPDYEGKRIAIDNWRRRHWTPALEAADLAVRGPYHLRHTYATWSLAAGLNIFTLARRMGTSVAMIDRTYGHLAVDADDREREMLDAWDSEPLGRLTDVEGNEQ